MKKMCKKNDRLCLDPDDAPNSAYCKATGPKGYLCCRKKGHDGDHVACGLGEDEHNMEIWPNREAE